MKKALIELLISHSLIKNVQKKDFQEKESIKEMVIDATLSL